MDYRSPSRRTGLLALVAVALVYAAAIQPLNWNATSHYALVQAFFDGTPIIDDYLDNAPTGDRVGFDGHWYSNKAPGLAYLSQPAYVGLKLVGLAGGDPVQVGPYATDRAVWLLGLWAAALPAFVLLLLVRSVAERIEPGLGAAAAVTVGLGTLLLPFATLLFAHVLATALVFGSFTVLFSERLRPGGPRRWALGAAGLLAGFAFMTEYPAALVGVVLAAYALAGAPNPRGALDRFWPFALGAFVGSVPLALYNKWAFDSFTKLAYSGIQEHQQGFFGIQMPDPSAAIQLLLTSRGLLTLAPVLVMAAVGLVLVWRRGWRAEALACGAVALVLFTYNAGYYLPYGGETPGPRFLILSLPFLGLGIASAFARFPGPTVALAGASVAAMVIPTMTGPAVGSEPEAGIWVQRLGDGDLQATAFTVIGVDTPWLAWLPALVLLGLALVIALRAVPRPSNRQLGAGLAAVAAWALFAAFGPHAFGIDGAAEETVALGLGKLPHPYGMQPIDKLALIGAVAGVVALAAARLSGRGAPAAPVPAATAGTPPAGSRSAPAP